MAHQARVEIFTDRKGQARWRLKAGNGETVATGEGHTSPSDARRAWRTVERIVIEGAGVDAVEPLPIRVLTTARRPR